MEKSIQNGEIFLTTYYCDIIKLYKKDNSVGKSLYLKNNSYILGLWCADGYHRTSSIGLTNCNPKLILKFYNFFKVNHSDKKIKLRIYLPKNKKPDREILKLAKNYKVKPNKNGKLVAYQLYVNSRNLLRNFKKDKTEIEKIKTKEITKYISGRFDGNGSINNDLKNEMRIVYGNKKNTLKDKKLLRKINIDTRVYHYKTAKTFCLYFTVDSAKTIVPEMKKYSLKISEKFALRDL